GADATATGPAPAGPVNGQPPAAPPPSDGQPAAAPPPSEGEAPEVPTPIAVPPGAGPLQFSGAKAAALQEVQSALDGVRQAQQSGDFAEDGQAAQRVRRAEQKYKR